MLVINLDSLITGDRLYFNAGATRRPQMAKRSRDRALDIAHRYGIAAASNPGSAHPEGTGCCSDQRWYSTPRHPVLSVEATNWSLGDKDEHQQRAVSPHFPQGITWHRPQYDNLRVPGSLPARADRQTQPRKRADPAAADQRAGAGAPAESNRRKKVAPQKQGPSIELSPVMLIAPFSLRVDRTRASGRRNASLPRSCPAPHFWVVWVSPTDR